MSSTPKATEQIKFMATPDQAEWLRERGITETVRNAVAAQHKDFPDADNMREVGQRDQPRFKVGQLVNVLPHTRNVTVEPSNNTYPKQHSGYSAVTIRAIYEDEAVEVFITEHRYEMFPAEHIEAVES